MKFGGQHSRTLLPPYGHIERMALAIAAGARTWQVMANLLPVIPSGGIRGTQVRDR